MTIMPKMIDITGQRFGKLLVSNFVERKNCHSWFKCDCDCGGMTVTTSNNLRRGHTVSCGCVSIAKFIERSRTHSMISHPTYRSWLDMRNRCYYVNHNRYEYYGGKGITVYDIWRDDFIEFYRWAIANGWKKGLTLDRKDNSKNYCPENCKWSTVKEQNRNRTSNVKITLDGVTKILIEWSEAGGINPQVIKKRIKNGWSIKDAIFKPVTKRQKINFE